MDQQADSNDLFRAPLKTSSKSDEPQSARNALCDDLESYHALIEMDPDAIIIHRNNRFLFANKEALRLYGAETFEQLSDHGVLQLISPEEREQESVRIQRVEAGDILPMYETRVLRLDKHEVPIEVSAKPVDYQGPGAIQAHMRDITERKRTEEALRAEKRRAEDYLNIAEVILVAIDRQAKITLLNRKGYQVLGYEEGELIGKDWFKTCLPPEEHERVYNAFKRLIAGEIETFEYYENNVLTKKGERRYIAWHNAILRDPDGRISGTLSSGEDITGRRRADEALKTANEELRATAEELHRQNDELLDTEKALQESEERYRTIIETANEGIWAMDGRHHITFVNQKIADMLGYRPDEIIGRLLEDFLFEEDLPDHRIRMERRRSGIKEQYERRLRRKDGSPLWTILSATPLEEAGKFAGAFAMVIDITNQKRTEMVLEATTEELRQQNDELRSAQKALQESEGRFRLAQDVANIGTFDWDLQAGVPIWTPKMEAMHGLPSGGFAQMLIDSGLGWMLNPAENLAHSEEERGKIVQLLAEKLYHPEDRDKFIQLFLRALETGAPAEGEWRVVWPDGSIHWHTERFQFFKDESGKPLRLTGVAIDITERKHAEEELRKSEERFRLAQDAANAGVLDWNVQTGEIVWTPRFEAMYGLQPGGLAQMFATVDNKVYLKDPAEIARLAEKLVYPEDQAKVMQLVERAFKTGAPVEGEWRLVWPDGSIHWQSFRIQAFKDESGRPMRLTGISIDITERKRAEEERQRNSENMEMLIRESPTPIIFVNSEGQIIIINRKAENLLGYGPGELLGSNLSTILPGSQHLDVANRIDQPIRIVNKLGTEVPSAISTSIQPFKDKKSGLQGRGMIVILKDLSELQGLSIAPMREVAVATRAKAEKPVLEQRYVYLVEEEQPSRSIAILRDMVEHGAQGLVISREKPEKIRSTCHLEKTPFIWLTRNKISEENCIAPDELTKLNKTAENFLEKAEQGVLFFDGLEYLIAQNGFNIVLKFLYSLNDAIRVHNSLAIWVIDPLALDARELHTLRRETRSIQP